MNAARSVSIDIDRIYIVDKAKITKIGCKLKSP